MSTRRCKNEYFPVDGARWLLSGLSVVAPSEVCISCDAVRDTGKWCCSLVVPALNVDSSISLHASPERAVDVTAPFCSHLSFGAFAIDTDESWTSDQTKSEV